MATAAGSRYRPRRLHISWATPLATTPEPDKVALKQMREERMKREAMRKRVSKQGPTLVRWAYPIATVADDKQKACRVHFADEPHVAWSDPIATIAEPGEAVNRRIVVFEDEKVLLSKKKIVDGQLVGTGRDARVVGIEDPSPPREDLYQCPEVKGASTTAMTLFNVTSSPSIGVEKSSPPHHERLYQCPDVKGESTTAMTSLNVASSPSWMRNERGLTDVVDVKGLVPAAEAQEINVVAEGQMAQLVRKWRYEWAWSCEPDETPLMVEEQLLLYKKDVLRLRRHPSKGGLAPWYAYGLACCWTILMLGVIIWGIMN